MIKNPSFAAFMSEVESYISTLTNDDLKKIITSLAEKQKKQDRNDFLIRMKESLQPSLPSKDTTDFSESSADKLIEKIKEFENRIKDGDFYDEEKSDWAYEREERSYWNRDDEDDDLDFSDEEYVIEAEQFLEKAKWFFRARDVKTALSAYKMLFDIFENPHYYNNEYFVYDFSFDDVLDADFLKEHRTIYLRCQYLECQTPDDYQTLYRVLIKESGIFLSDLIEIDRTPLPHIDDFIDGFIRFLEDKTQYDSHVIDILSVKGGIAEVKKYAYSNGDKHPSVFSYYYETLKQGKLSSSDQLSLILDGITIIPEKFCIRSTLGLDLVRIAQELNDKNYLLTGYSTAFYSNPTCRNLIYYIDFITSEKKIVEIEQLKKYLARKKERSSETRVAHFSEYDSIDNFSLATAAMDSKTQIIGRFLLDDITLLVNKIDPKLYLGFSGTHNAVAVAVALTLKALSGNTSLIIVNKLLDLYCLDAHSDEYPILKKLIDDRVKKISLDPTLIRNVMNRSEELAVNRVAHILSQKLRGGYDSSCLLLVACAEVKQHLFKTGNDLVLQIDNKYKKYSAFRPTLKKLTSLSTILAAIR